MLTQSGTDAPVATVLENTLGDIVWTRISTGYYIADANLLNLDREKTTIFIGALDLSTLTLGYVLTDLDADYFSIFTYNTDYISSDAVIYKTPIEIRVYN